MRRHGNLEPRSGAVCLAGRCCGSASQLAWICIPPRLTLAIPNPFLSPVKPRQVIVPSSEKSLQIFDADPYFKTICPAGLVPIETVGLLVCFSAGFWHALTKANCVLPRTRVLCEHSLLGHVRIEGPPIATHCVQTGSNESQFGSSAPPPYPRHCSQPSAGCLRCEMCV